MIKKILKRSKERDTYLTHVYRALQLMKATVLAESSSFFHFHRELSASAMSTDMSQVGVALFPSFKYIFNNFTFPGFPFILIIFFSRVL